MSRPTADGDAPVVLITLPRPVLEACWGDTKTEPLYGECQRHGLGFIVEYGSNPGFTGAPIYWATLSCGCQDVDASADNIEAVR